MKEVYALCLIKNLITEEEIIDLYDEDYLKEVLEIKNDMERIKIAFNYILRGWNNMTLVYILALRMGLVTKENIPEEDLILVEEALKNIGEEHLLG